MDETQLFCGSCGEAGDGQSLRRCTGCLQEWYCNKECQSKHWADHKPDCDSRSGCEHYKRGCLLKAPCCGKFVGCRRCHDEDESLSACAEKFDRSKVQVLKCRKCSTEQPVSNKCTSCGAKFGEYYCETCRLFDHDTSKGQYHCDGCGICRVGGRENHRHCDRCSVCYHVNSFDDHTCVEKALEINCPVCLEYLHDSTKKLFVPKCGHFLHYECFAELCKTQYTCPTCNKSLFENMSTQFEALDLEIQLTPMPLEFRNMVVEVLCNDCNQTTNPVPYHILGHKCGHCNSYNTAVTNGPFHPEQDQEENDNPIDSLMVDAVEGEEWRDVVIDERTHLNSDSTTDFHNVLGEDDIVQET